MAAKPKDEGGGKPKKPKAVGGKGVPMEKKPSRVKAAEVPAAGAVDEAMQAAVAGAPPGVAEWLAKLLKPVAPHILASRVPLPEPVENGMPEVYLDADVLVVATELGEICRGDELYRMDRQLVTIDEGTGQTLGMSPKRFVTWASERAKFYKMGKEGPKYESMTEQMASLILASDRFSVKIRPVVSVHLVRQPVRRKGGKVELLEEGYDAEQRIFTVRQPLIFDEGMDVLDAVRYLKELLGSFPYGDPEQGMANVLAYLLTLFCRAMVAPAKVPGWVFLANLVGSGKSIMAMMGMRVIYGKSTMTTLAEPNELKKTLDMAARYALPYLFFDNLTGTLKSPLLDAWATGEEWGGRVIGTGEAFEMRTTATLIFTGNGLKLSDDQDRRTIKIDLFATEGSADRPEPVVDITEEWLVDPVNRSKILACLWALVRYAFCEEAGTRQGKVAGKGLASFKKWSSIVPEVLVRCGFSDPLNKVVLPDAGNMAEEDTVRCLRAVLVSLNLAPGQSGRVELKDIVPVARLNGCFTDRLGTVEDIMVKLDGMHKGGGWKEEEYPGEVSLRLPQTEEERRQQAARWIDPDRGAKEHGTLSSLGYRIRKKCGQTIKIPATKQGQEAQEYQFSTREGARHSVFVVVRVK